MNSKQNILHRKEGQGCHPVVSRGLATCEMLRLLPPWQVHSSRKLTQALGPELIRGKINHYSNQSISPLHSLLLEIETEDKGVQRSQEPEHWKSICFRGLWVQLLLNHLVSIWTLISGTTNTFRVTSSRYKPWQSDFLKIFLDDSEEVTTTDASVVWQVGPWNGQKYFFLTS